MRQRWPRTDKHKLMLLLRADGVEVSASTVGSIPKRAGDRARCANLSHPQRALNRMCGTGTHASIRRPGSVPVTCGYDLQPFFACKCEPPS